jgi:hypothetical protein
MWLLANELGGFSSREIASAFWLCAFLLWGFSHEKVRKGSVDVLLAAAQVKIAVPVLLLVLYVGSVVAALSFTGAWTTDLVKDTLLWFAFSGLIFPFSFVTGKYEGRILPQLIKDAVSVLVLLEFLVGTYTFPLILELIVLPVITIVALLGAFAETSKGHPSVAKLMGALQMLFGLVVLSSALHKAAGDFGTLTTLASLCQLMLPVFLSLSLAPFTYMLLAYVNYENLFIRLRFHVVDPAVRRYAKRRIALHLRFNPHRVKQFQRDRSLELLSVQTKDDVDRLLRT